MSQSLETIAGDTQVAIIFEFDKANNQITVKIGETVAQTTLTSWSEDVSSVFIGTARGKAISINNIFVKDNTYKDDDTTVTPSPEPIKTEVTSVKNEDNKATVSVTVADGENIDLNVYIAQYDANGRIISIKMYGENVQESKDIIVSYEKISDADSILVYVWNSDMLPLCEKN